MRYLILLIVIVFAAASADAARTPRFAVTVAGTSTTTWAQDGCVAHLTATNECVERRQASGTDKTTFRTPHPILLTLGQLRNPGQLQLNHSVSFSATIFRQGTGTRTDPRNGQQQALDTTGCGTVTVTVPSGGITLGWEGSSQTFKLGLERLGASGLEGCPTPAGTGMLPIRGLRATVAQPLATTRRAIVISGSTTIDRSHAQSGITGLATVSWTVRLVPAP